MKERLEIEKAHNIVLMKCEKWWNSAHNTTVKRNKTMGQLYENPNYIRFKITFLNEYKHGAKKCIKEKAWLSCYLFTKVPFVNMCMSRVYSLVYFSANISYNIFCMNT